MKIGALSGAIVLSVFVFMVLVVPVLANTHTSITEVIPEWSQASDSIEFAITVENDGGSADSIDEVRIRIPTTGFSGLVCGTAPDGWSLSYYDGSNCYYTTSTPSYYISPGDSLDFVVTATTASSSGEYEWQVKTFDEAGYPYTTNPTSSVDSEAPTTSDDAPVGWQTTSPVTITLTESDPDPSSGIAWTRYCIDSANTCDPELGTDYTVPVEISAEGISYFRYVSEDNVGNQQETVSREIKIDTVDPESEVNPLDPYQTSLTFDIPYDASDNVGLKRVRLYKNIDGGGWQYHAYYIIPGEPTSYSGIISFTAPGDGVYEFYTSAVDMADNDEDALGTADAYTTVDTTPPEITGTSVDNDVAQSGTVIIISSDINDETSGVNEATMYAYVQKPDESNVATIPLIWLDSPVEGEWDTTGFEDGTYYVDIVTSDNAGNSAEDENGAIVVIDSVSPTTTDDASDIDGIWQTTSPVTITLTESDPDPSSGIAWTRYCIDSANTCDPELGTDYTVPVEISAEGISYFRYVSEDNAGNRQDTINREIKIDTVDPITTDNAPSSWQNADIIVTLTPSDDTSGVADTLYCQDQTDTCTPTASGTSVLVDTEGINYVRYYSVDNAGNDEGINSVMAQLDKTDPITAEITSPQDGDYINGNVIIEANAEDNVDGSGIEGVEFYANPDGEPVCIDTEEPYECEWDTTGESDGSHDLWIVAYDNAENSLKSDTITVVVDNTVPTAEISYPDGEEKYYITGTIDIGGFVYDENIAGWVLEYCLEGDECEELASCEGSECNIDDILGTWDTTGVDDGEYELVLTATDLAGLDSFFDVFVFVDNTPPVITPVYPQDGETIYYNDVEIIVELCDEGSGIDEESIIFTVDGEEILWEDYWNDCLEIVSYTEVDLLEGEHIVYIYVADNADPSSELTWSFTVSNEYELWLGTPWNLISLPLIPEDSDIEVVLSEIEESVDVVWSYDTLNDVWYCYDPDAPCENGLTEMEDGKGYWMKMLEPAEFTIYGVEMYPGPAMPPAYPVYEGWNLIGFKSTQWMPANIYLQSLIGSWLDNPPIIIGYDPDYGWDTIECYPYAGECDLIEPGYGYWLYTNEDGIIAPPTRWGD